MAGEQDKFELSSKQKTQLLNLGLKTAPADIEGQESREDLLYDVLRHPLPLDVSKINLLPPPLRGLSRRVRSITGAPLSELLTDSNTDIAALEKIKEYTKQSGKSTKSEGQMDVLFAIYYAAIASGLLFHDRKITEHSYDHLANAFESLAEKNWIIKKVCSFFIIKI